MRAEQAGALYLAGDYDGAARGWRALVDEGWESVGLHLDLGNALLRLGHRGRAIASYQRALQLDPGDADTQANLEQARAQNVDRLVGEAQPPLHARVLARTPDGAALALFGLLLDRLLAPALAPQPVEPERAPLARAGGAAGGAAGGRRRGAAGRQGGRPAHAERRW